MSEEEQAAIDRWIQGKLSDSRVLIGDLAETIGKLPASDVVDAMIKLRELQAELDKVGKNVGLRQQLRDAPSDKPS